MATIYFQPNAAAVAQESRATPANVEIGDVFTLLVNGVAIGTFTASAGTVANVTAGLTSAWNASTHDYAADIVASDQTTYVKLLGPVGMPFTVTATATDGGGANTQTLTMTTPTAATGPYHWNDADNWSAGAVPANGDVVHVADTVSPILYGLDQNGVTLAQLIIWDTFTGKIGLDYQRYATSADGATQVNLSDYRDTHLKIGATICEIGKRKGDATATGSARILIDLHTAASTCIVHSTAAASDYTGRPAVRIKATHASTDIIVRESVGGVGIATEKAGETSTVRNINVLVPSTSSTVSTGPGCTITGVKCTGGTATINAASIAEFLVTGGDVTTEGDYTITSAINDGADWVANHIKTGGAAVTLADLRSGTTNTDYNGRSPVWTTVRKSSGATFTITSVQITNYTPYDAGGFSEG